MLGLSIFIISLGLVIVLLSPIPEEIYSRIGILIIGCSVLSTGCINIAIYQEQKSVAKKIGEGTHEVVPTYTITQGDTTDVTYTIQEVK